MTTSGHDLEGYEPEFCNLRWQSQMDLAPAAVAVVRSSSARSRGQGRLRSETGSRQDSSKEWVAIRRYRYCNESHGVKQNTRHCGRAALSISVDQEQLELDLDRDFSIK
ncbi:hypothetical protein E4U16_003604, partial [Claviceps sp. LM84 group G4]